LTHEFDPLNIELGDRSAYRKYMIEASKHIANPVMPLLIAANGGDISLQFSPWLDDYIMSEGQWMKQNPEIVERFIGLRFLSKGYPTQPYLPGVKQALVTRRYAHTRNFELLADRIRKSAHAEIFGGIGVENLLDHVNAQAFEDESISQFHRAKQLDLRALAIDLLFQTFSALANITIRHDATCAIRPIYTMPSPKADKLRDEAMRTELYDIDYYLSQGALRVSDSMKANRLFWLLGKGDPAWNRKNYWNWHYRTSYAMIQMPNIEIHYAPHSLIPSLLHRADWSIPVFVDVPRPAFTINESIYTIGWWNGGDPPVHINEDYQLMGEALALLCACATLVSITTATGKGQHKPVWTTSPFNTAMLKLFPMAAKYTLDKLKAAA
jgi:hypothetical protein